MKHHACLRRAALALAGPVTGPALADSVRVLHTDGPQGPLAGTYVAPADFNRIISCHAELYARRNDATPAAPDRNAVG